MLHRLQIHHRRMFQRSSRHHAHHHSLLHSLLLAQSLSSAVPSHRCLVSLPPRHHTPPPPNTSTGTSRHPGDSSHSTANTTTTNVTRKPDRDFLYLVENLPPSISIHDLYQMVRRAQELGVSLTPYHDQLVTCTLLSCPAPADIALALTRLSATKKLIPPEDFSPALCPHSLSTHHP